MEKIRVDVVSIVTTPKQTGDGMYLVVRPNGHKHSILLKYAEGIFSVGETAVLWENIGAGSYYRSISKE